jgi:PGF-pre-PGF domain-containing protein/uncharacterized delta-60 repeat protein
MLNYKSLLNVTSITDQGKKNSIPGTLRDTQNMCSPGRKKYPRNQNLVLGVCFFLACITVLSSCASAGIAPVANFSADATSGAFPLLVNFNDLSSNTPTGWAWYFGDEDMSGAWTEVNSSAGWSARYSHSSVVLPDGSIVLMGGKNDTVSQNDTWRSTDNGANWTLMNSSAGWSTRYRHSSVVLPDGSIVLMGGLPSKNDTWRSEDEGATWTVVNSSSGWSARYGHSSVVLSDGSIVLMGGWDQDPENDTWRSEDDGLTWTLMNSSSGWSARNGHNSVVLPDGSIVLMGGYSRGGYLNDTWLSEDDGATWTEVNSSSGWSARSSHSSVVLPDGSIVLMGGMNDGNYQTDVWRSTDNGATWTEVNSSSGWSARGSHSSVVLPDGSIVLMGGQSMEDMDGMGGPGMPSYKNDVWRLTTASSSERDPSHTYTGAGTYQVTLQAYNSAGYNSIIRTDYITVTGPLAPVANFSADPTSGAFPLLVNFTDQSTNTPAGWAWYFGDEDFSEPWTMVNDTSARWSARYSHSSVVLPDGSIVLMGGWPTSGGIQNDTWQSTDNGTTWTELNQSSGWSARCGHSSVVLPDGSIVLMGGESTGGYKNDTWRSTDNGANWTLMNSSSGWSARFAHSSVVLPDGSIVLMGGRSSSGIQNDTWRSTDNGANWTLMNSSAGWDARTGHSSVVLSGGSIVLMGGYDGNSSGYFYNDVWRSTDNGTTWTKVNSSAGWSARHGHNSVVLPDSSIVLMGGRSSSGTQNDEVWRSTDDGATWTEVNSSAGWSVRHQHSSVVLPDGSIVLMGGWSWEGSNYFRNDVWRLTTAGSSEKDPYHTYTEAGTYQVTLQAYNSEGYNSIIRTDYITVTGPLAPVANFTANVTSGAVPLTVNFTDWSENSPTSWFWDFGDGTNSNNRNVTHTYTTAGTFIVNLTATNVGGSNVSTQTIITDVVPVANFSADVTSGAAPLAVSFTDQSTNATAWYWDFGDGNASTDQNPIHTYMDVGTYTVNLTAINNISGNDTLTRTDYITVAIAPVANFTANVTSGAVPLTVNFTDDSTNDPTDWEWNFGDGNTSTDQNPTHTYTSVGTYDVSLNASNLGGYNITTKTSYITAAYVPVANFSANVTSGAVPLSVNFTDTSLNDPTGWEWDFGDGGTSDEQHPTYNYTSAGNYTVSLNVTNIAGSNISAKIDYITTAYVPVANFSADVTSGAAPLAVSFTDQSTNATAWYWDFGDGNASTDQNPIHTYMDVGTYTVNLTAINSISGNDTLTRTIITDVVPVANFSADVTSGALPLVVNFTDMSTNATAWYWEFGDGNVSALRNPTHTYMDVGTYTVNLTAINAISGNDTMTRTDHITAAIAPVANFTASATSGTVPFAVTFTDLSTNSPTSWAWDFGDGATSTDQNATHTYTTAGTYAVSLNASNVGGSNVSTQMSYITVSSTSSGSGSRASVSPGQPPEIVKSTHTSIKHVMGGTSVEYDLSDGNGPVLGISFDAKDNEGVVVAKVQVLSDRPEGVSTPPGNSYQLMSIDVGSQGTISSHNADNIMINFRVSWEWINENNIDPATIRMTRYYDGEWQELPTGKVSDDGEYLYFVAETQGFSIFSVVGDELKAVINEAEPVAATFAEEKTGNPVNAEDKKTPGFTALSGLAFVSVAFLTRRKFRK